MKLFEAISYCLSKENNSVYCRSIDAVIFSGSYPADHSKTLFMFMTTKGCSLPSPFPINSHLLHCEFEVME